MNTVVFMRRNLISTLFQAVPMQDQENLQVGREHQIVVTVLWHRGKSLETDKKKTNNAADSCSSCSEDKIRGRTQKCCTAPAENLHLPITLICGSQSNYCAARETKPESKQSVDFNEMVNASTDEILVQRQ